MEDRNAAKHYLNNISYYHLSGYFKPFQNDDTFFEKTTFEEVLNLYFFDRKLRLLFLNGLERIEKSFKAQFIYQLSTKYGAHCLTESKTFEKHSSKVKESLLKSKEPFIKNFREKYSNEHPPIWMLIEILSFGEILNIFITSLDNDDRKTISRFFGLGWPYLFTWLENLREVRNICAHYSRLWNRKITKHLKRGDQYPELQYDNHVFDSIIISSILLKKVSPSYDWLLEIRELIQEYKISLKKIGFPENWEEIFDSLAQQSINHQNHGY